MQNDYTMCEKLNLLQQHWRKLSVTETIPLVSFSTLKIVNFCIYSVSAFVL